MAYLANGKGDPYNLGYFETPTALTTAYPVGSTGFFAIVASTNSIWIWNETLQIWVNTAIVPASAGYQIPISGVVNGVNQTYTWTVAPNAIVIDETRIIQKLQSDGVTANWTGTTTITLLIWTPQFDIYSIA